MNYWKKFCAAGLGLSLIMATNLYADEIVVPSSEHIIAEAGEAAGLIGGAGIVDCIAEDEEPAGSQAQFEVVEPQEESYDTCVLADGIEVKVPDSYNTFLGSDGNFYVCPYRDYEIPYVMFGIYSYSGDDFFDLLTPEVISSCENGAVAEEEKDVQIGDYTMKKIVYSYDFQGNVVIDTRLSMKVGNMFVIFGSKECPQTNVMLGSLLEEVASGLSVSQAETGTGSLPPAPGEIEVQADNQADYAFDLTFDQGWASYQGIWIPFDNSYQLYLPKHWVYYDISEEEKACNVYYHCGNDGGDIIVGDTDVHIVVSRGQVGPDFDMQQMAANLAQNGYENVFFGKVNGMEAIAYEITQSNLVGFFFQSPNEPGIVISVEGYYNGADNTVAANMVQTIVFSVSSV